MIYNLLQHVKYRFILVILVASCENAISTSLNGKNMNDTKTQFYKVIWLITLKLSGYLKMKQPYYKSTFLELNIPSVHITILQIISLHACRNYYKTNLTLISILDILNVIFVGQWYSNRPSDSCMRWNSPPND